MQVLRESEEQLVATLKTFDEMIKRSNEKLGSFEGREQKLGAESRAITAQVGKDTLRKGQYEQMLEQQVGVIKNMVPV